MSEWIDFKPQESPLKLGDKFDAVIGHCNKEKLGLDDEEVKLEIGEDNMYFQCGGELSWNWDVIKIRNVSKC